MVKPPRRLPSFAGTMNTTFSGQFVSLPLQAIVVQVTKAVRASVAYVIIEAHYCAATPEAASLWVLINDVCKVFPNLTVIPERPDVVATKRLIVLAWQPRQEHLQKLHGGVEKPWCVGKMEDELKSFTQGPKVSETDSGWNTDSAAALDFDMIDWSAWELEGYVQVLN